MSIVTIERAADPVIVSTSGPLDELLRGDPFEATFEAAGVGLAIVDVTGCYVRVNRAYARVHAVLAEDLIGTTLVEPAQVAEFLGPESPLPLRGDLEVREGIWVNRGISLHRDAAGRPAWFIVDEEDVTRRHRAEADLAHRALHDPLTGLPNRVLCNDHLRQALARAERVSGSIGVLFIDLDGFKEINDRHGHRLGDMVLRVVADRLRQAVRPSDTVARLGGDEFLIVVDTPTQEADLVALVQRVRAAIEPPLREQGTQTRVGASVGYALSRRGDDPEAVVARADASMYEQKRLSKKQASATG